MPITPVSTSALIPRVRDLLADTPFLTTSSTTGTGATVTIPDTSTWAAGDILEWQSSDYEQALVSAIVNGTDMTVSRGVNGTTATSHTNPTTVAQNPGHTGRQITQALNAGVRNLWPFVYRAEDVTLTPVAGKYWYDVTAPLADALGIISVTQLYGSSPGLLQAKYGKDHGLRFDPEMNTSVVPSGQGLYIPYLVHPTNNIIVKVMEAVTGDNDIEDNSLFPVGDHLVYFAAGRLTAAGEISRVTSGEDLEANASVETGSRVQTGGAFSAEAKRMLQTLAVKYEQHYRPVLRP